ASPAPSRSPRGTAPPSARKGTSGAAKRDTFSPHPPAAPSPPIAAHPPRARRRPAAQSTRAGERARPAPAMLAGAVVEARKSSRLLPQFHVRKTAARRREDGAILDHRQGQARNTMRKHQGANVTFHSKTL